MNNGGKPRKGRLWQAEVPEWSHSIHVQVIFHWRIQESPLKLSPLNSHKNLTKTVCFPLIRALNQISKNQWSESFCCIRLERWWWRSSKYPTRSDRSSGEGAKRGMCDILSDICWLKTTFIDGLFVKKAVGEKNTVFWKISTRSNRPQDKDQFWPWLRLI